MCTIMTFDKETFDLNKEAILAQVKKDGVGNGHGWNLIIAGKKEEDVIFFQCLELGWITSMLESVTDFQRFWLHARYSTTGTKGLSGCHGFRSYTGWFVQHNGILRSGRADKLPVDSMVISELLEFMSPNHVAQWLLAKETYANVFMINPTEGQYHVVRCDTGVLRTDSKGNYSSQSIKDVCEQEVPKQFHSTHTFTVERPTVHSFSYGHGYGHGGGRYPGYARDVEDDDWAQFRPPYVKKEAAKKNVVVAPSTPALPAASSTPVEAKEEAGTRLIASDFADLTDEDCLAVMDKLSHDEVRSMFYGKVWDVNGVPKDVFNKAPKKQKQWLGRFYAECIAARKHINQSVMM